jgi:cell wall-associated NlpC family hydrolase
MKLDPFGMSALAVGALVTYAGVTGKSIPDAFQAIITGKSPTKVKQANPITTPSGDFGGGTLGAPSGSNPAVAEQALTYLGKMRYVWGGAPSSGGVDCSSFVNMVVGRDLTRAIPTYKAGAYTGSTHGPPTGGWLIWNGCRTVSHDGKDALPGDICVWATHMGIATGNGKMISARSAMSNPNIGIDTINGDIPGERVSIRRLQRVPGGAHG